MLLLHDNMESLANIPPASIVSKYITSFHDSWVIGNRCCVLPTNLKDEIEQTVCRLYTEIRMSCTDTVVKCLRLSILLLLLHRLEEAVIACSEAVSSYSKSPLLSNNNNNKDQITTNNNNIIDKHEKVLEYKSLLLSLEAYGAYDVRAIDNEVQRSSNGSSDCTHKNYIHNNIYLTWSVDKGEKEMKCYSNLCAGTLLLASRASMLARSSCPVKVKSDIQHASVYNMIRRKLTISSQLQSIVVKYISDENTEYKGQNKLFTDVMNEMCTETSPHTANRNIPVINHNSMNNNFDQLLNHFGAPVQDHPMSAKVASMKDCNAAISKDTSKTFYYGRWFLPSFVPINSCHNCIVDIVGDFMFVRTVRDVIAGEALMRPTEFFSVSTVVNLKKPPLENTNNQIQIDRLDMKLSDYLRREKYERALNIIKEILTISYQIELPEGKILQYRINKIKLLKRVGMVDVAMKDIIDLKRIYADWPQSLGDFELLLESDADLNL